MRRLTSRPDHARPQGGGGARAVAEQARQRRLATLQAAADASPRVAAMGAGRLLQRQAGEEEEPLQAKPAPRAENRTGMPDGLKAGVEALSGMDMSEVRVHGNSPEPAAVGALAYAKGNDIHLGPGQERHLDHEAWHVVQQRQGRVQPTTTVAGVAVNDAPSLEQEADVMGARAAKAGSI